MIGGGEGRGDGEKTNERVQREENGFVMVGKGWEGGFIGKV